MKGGAVRYNRREADRILAEKKRALERTDVPLQMPGDREAVIRQKEFRECFLQVKVKEAELGEMNRQVESGNVQVQWSGMTCPMSVLKASYNLQLNSFKEQLSRLKYLEAALKSDGLSESEIADVISGKYKANGNRERKD